LLDAFTEPLRPLVEPIAFPLVIAAAEAGGELKPH
jgi:hypothetical protein